MLSCGLLRRILSSAPFQLFRCSAQMLRGCRRRMLATACLPYLKSPAAGSKKTTAAERAVSKISLGPRIPSSCLLRSNASSYVQLQGLAEVRPSSWRRPKER